MNASGLWAAGVVLGLCGAASAGSPLSFAGDPGVVSDAAGDSRAADGYASPDLAKASVVVVGDQVRLRAGLTSAMDPNALFWFAFDTDCNRFTGRPGISSFGTDSAVLGSEVFVFASSAFGLSVYDSTSTAIPVANPAFTAFDDGIEVTLPLSIFGGTDGLMDYKVETRLFMNSAAMGGFDYLSDLGSAPARSVAAPEPAGAWLLILSAAAFLRRTRA